MRIIVVRTKTRSILSEEIDLKSRKRITLRDVLILLFGKDFKLNSDEKCWFKKAYEKEFNKTERSLFSELELPYHDNLIIAISPYYPPADIYQQIISYKPPTPNIDPVNTQKKERRRITPHLVKQRQMLLRGLKKRKNLERIESGKEKNQKDSEDKKTLDD